MADWWKDLLAQTGKNFDLGIGVLDAETKAADKDLEKQRGVFPAILRGFVKVGRLFIRLVVWGVSEFFPGLGSHANAIITGQVLEVPKVVWDESIERIGLSLALDASSITLLKSYYQPLKGASPVVQGIGLVMMYTSLLSFLTGPGLGKVVRALMRKIRPLAPGPGEVMGAAALDPEVDKRIWEALRNNGFEDKDIELLFMSTYARHNPDDVRRMYYLGVLDAKGAINRLSELRYTPERIKELMATWPAIPGIQDLIMMSVKEAFDEAAVERFTLDVGFPGEVAEWAAKQGLDKDWSKRYWRAHWLHPSAGQGMEMLHRDLISKDDLAELLRVLDYPQFWREKLLGISYNTLGRVDVRRMWQLGVIDDEVELHRRYRHMGYSPDDATTMVQWTKTYAESTEKELTRADIVAGYIEGDLSSAEALGYLKRSGYSYDTAGYILHSADLKKLRDRRTLLTKILHDEYTGKVVTEAEARGRLIGMEYSVGQVSDLLSLWKLELKPPAVAVVKEIKLPSKTDLDKFLKAGIIDEATYKVEMAALGYEEKIVQRYIDLLILSVAVSE